MRWKTRNWWSPLLLGLLGAALLLGPVRTSWSEDPFALGMRAQEYIGHKQFEKAIPPLIEALKEDPMNTWLRGMLAASYYQLKKFGDAKREYELISSLEKDNELARFMVGVLTPLADLDQNLLTKRSEPARKELKPYEIEQKYGRAVTYLLVADKNKRVFKTGSGFIIRPDGWVVTNHHVVVNGKYIVAKLPSGERYPSKTVIAYSPKYDLAVIKLENAVSLPTVKLGDSSKVILGEQAVAIGNPEGMEHTISDGLVSAWRDLGQGFKYIQISVPISHGSSGGPLFNMRGEVIGVTSAGLKQGQNLNFAVPINRVKEILKNPQYIALSELPEEKKQTTQPAPPKNQTDAEFVRTPEGRIQCTNRKIGFRFMLTPASWRVKEEIDKTDYLLKCSSRDFQVVLNTFKGKQGLTEEEMLASFRNHFQKNGFVLQKDFQPARIQGNRVFVGVLDKETEQQLVRTYMLILLKDGRVYNFGTWFLAGDESKLSSNIRAILGSFQVKSASAG